MGAIAVSLRRLPAERAAAAGFALLVFVTALCFAIAPRLADHLATDGLHVELAAAGPAERNLNVIETTRGSAAVIKDTLALDDLAAVHAAQAGLEARLPATVGALIADRHFVLDTSLWEVATGAGAPTVLSLRIQEGIEDRLKLTAGRMPTGTVTVAEDPRPEAPPGSHAVVYEAILPATAAAEAGVGVGSTLTLVLSHLDALNGGRTAAAAIKVVGTFSVVDPADPFWIDDATVGGFQRVGNDLQIIETSAILSPAVYTTLVANTRDVGLALKYQWRFYVDADRLEATDLDAAVVDLRQMESSPPRTGISKVFSDTTLRSGLLRLLAAHQERWRSVDAILAVAWLGTALLAAATLLVVGVLASAGRRRVAWLLRARGAARAQLLTASAAEGVLLTVPVVALAAALAVAVVPSASPILALLPTVAVAVVASAVLVAVVVGSPAGGVIEPSAAVRRVVRFDPRRLVIEAVVVAVAIAGAFLLRERSVSGSGTSGQLAGADPIIAAVPALVGVAAGIVAMRLYPLPTRLLSALAARRRDLVPVLAVRRATRGRATAPVLLILVATATIGAFASATLAHLDRGADLAAWQEVGAPYRLTTTAPAFPTDFDPSTLPGVEAAAQASFQPVVTSRGRSSLLLLDAAAYATVVQGTGADPGLPAAMLMLPPAGPPTGHYTDPLPVVVSPDLGVGVGDGFNVTIFGNSAPVRVAGVAPSFPGIAAGTSFVVLSRQTLAAIDPEAARRTAIAFLHAPPAADSRLRAAVAALGPGLTLESQASAADDLRSSPVIGAVRAGVAAAAIAAVAFAALAVAAALALAGAAGRIEMAHLRIFGLTRRQAAWLIFVEHGPSAVVAYAGGVGLGLGLFAFLLPGLGLQAVIGVPVAVPLTVDPVHLLLLLAAIVGTVVVGWALGIRAQSDTDPATTIRGGTP
ncbi:MAG: FtsX-like permease family protein [Candidatus Limnocylindrales bacterium]